MESVNYISSHHRTTSIGSGHRKVINPGVLDKEYPDSAIINLEKVFAGMDITEDIG